MLTKRKWIFSKIISIVLAASVILTSNGILAVAENVQTVQTAEPESSVIEISSANDLQKIADNLTGDYVLTEDIDMSGKDYVPIGNNKEPFTGTFDGNGHIISDLNISVENSNESSFVGFFGVTENATVRNLAVENCTIISETTGGIYAGVIAGKMKNSLIEDVYVSGQIQIKERTAYSVGGIAGAVFQNGDNAALTIEHNAARCVGSVEINVPEDADGEYGALAGYVEDTALVANSYSFVPDAKLFGVQVSVDNSCKLLSENTWNKENSYIGFDFENVWKITDGGARLIRQTYEKTEEIEQSSSDVNETAEATENPKVQIETDESAAEADSSQNLEVIEEKASDNGIMLLASDLASGDFTYTVSGNNATITGYTGSLTDLSIPSSIGEYTVTTIGSSAFKGNSTIRSVSLPNTITSVGGSAFQDCTALKTVTMNYNSTVEYTASIGGYAFSGCTSLTSIGLSENVTSIGYEAFSGCTALESLTLPESLQSMGRRMIESTAISSITIPKNVSYSSSTSFSGALANCKSLTEVIFEDGMTKIPNYICASGSYTSYIAKVVIPESVTSIGSYAFYKCDNMTIYGYKNSYAESYAITESIPFVSVAVGKNTSAEDVLEKLDVDRLLNNLSLGSTEVQGPSVEILGTTFNLFSFPSSIDIPLNDKVQAKVDTEKKTIQVLVGFDKFDGSANLSGDNNSDNYWKESYKEVKSLYTGFTGKETGTQDLYNGFRKLRKHLRKFDASMGVSASASAAGYIEFSYVSGEICFSSGGILLEAELGTSVEYPFPPCPVFYAAFDVGVGFDGKLTLTRNSANNYTPAINAGVTLDATIRAGAGRKKAKTYAELGLHGGIRLEVDTSVDAESHTLANSMTLSLVDAYAYADTKAFGFDGPKWKQEWEDYTLYPRSSERSALVLQGLNFDNFSLEDAKPSDRAYLNEAMPIALDLYEDSAIYTKNNLYRYNSVQMAYLNDGTILMAWIDDNGEKSDVNKTSLMYSVYDGTAWSEAEAIAETGGANDYPCIYSDGDKAHIVWQKADSLPDSASLPDVLKTVELYCVTYQDGEMGDASAITSGNDTYEMMQSVVGKGDNLAVAWVENSGNDPFQSEGTSNILKVSEYKDGKWEERVWADSIGSIANINVGYAGEQLVVSYENTDTENSEITLLTGDEKMVFAGFGAELSDGILYYGNETGVQSYDIVTTLNESVIDKKLDDFLVLDNGSSKMMVSTVYSGFACELVMYQFDRTTGTWSDAVTLTDDGKYIRDYAPVLDKDGNLTVALNMVEVNEQDEEVYGNASLKVMNFSDTEDLIVGEGAYFDNASLVPCGTLPLNFGVTNNGTKAVSEIHVDILDSSNAVLQSGTVSCAIGAGETADVSYNYTLPAVLTGDTITIKAYTENETKLTDNTVSLEIGNMYLSGNSSAATLKGEIQNVGYKAASDVTVTVYDANEEGDVIGTVSLGAIEISGAKAFEVSIPEAYLDVNPLVSGNELYVVASASSDEMDYANNTDTYLIKSPADEPLVLNFNEITLGSDGSESLEVTYSPVVDVASEEIEWTSNDESVVTVQDGKLTAVGTGEATVTATIKGYTVSCVIKVNNNVAVTGIYLEENSVSILAGQTKQLTANILPANATNQTVTWESSDQTVATVSNDGIVRAVAVGTAEITAYTEDGYKMADCSVTVFQDLNTIYQVTFSGGTDTSGIRPSALSGTAGTIVALPENPYTKDGYHFLGWTDGKNTYEENAPYRIPYRDVVMTASWASDEKQEFIISASCQTGGSITPDGEVAVTEGETQKFAITADEGYRISDVKVDGESVGAVSEYTFEDVSANHTIEALFNKAVSVKIENIQLSQTKVTLEKGQTLLLDAVITPDKAEDKQLKWSSSNIDVASVKNGLVTAIGTGTATITAESMDGSNVKASCVITVTMTTKVADSSTSNSGPLKGTVLQDSKNKVSYKVTSRGKTVAFYKVNNKKATKVVIPATVTISGIKYKVTAISGNAFSGCKKIKSVTIGKNVTTIGNKAFFKCTSLKKMTIPTSVKKIGKKAFYGCSKLKSITIKTQNLKSKSVGAQAFKGIYKKAVVKVPKKQKKAYQKWLRKKGITKKMKIK